MFGRKDADEKPINIALSDGRIESKLKHKQELEADDFADKFFRRLKID